MIYQLEIPIIPTNIPLHPYHLQVLLLSETSKLALILNGLVRPPRGA